jgi:hypothetical protein
MAIQDARISTDDPSWVHVFGEPIDVEYVMGRTDAVGVMIAGYDVKNMGDAQHDGAEALRFTLTADNREVGRLVIMTATTEYTFEFDVEFDNETQARDFVDRVKNPPTKLTVAKVEGLDFSYDGELLEELAIMSAKHGISTSVTDPSGPGGGWPVVSISGLAENVKRCLMADDYGWGFMESEADAMMLDGLETI